jgi:hypothetical protein
MQYVGERLSITPATTTDNWTLDAGSGEVGRIIEVTVSGEIATSGAMATRVAKSSGASGALTTISTIMKPFPSAPTNAIDFGTPYAVTQPTLDAGAWFARSWNAHGGYIHYWADPAYEALYFIGAKTVSCRNTVGTSTSSYTVRWEEL